MSEFPDGLPYERAILNRVWFVRAMLNDAKIPMMALTFQYECEISCPWLEWGKSIKFFILKQLVIDQIRPELLHGRLWIGSVLYIRS